MDGIFIAYFINIVYICLIFSERYTYLYEKNSRIVQNIAELIFPRVTKMALLLN